MVLSKHVPTCQHVSDKNASLDGETQTHTHPMKKYISLIEERKSLILAHDMFGRN